MERFWSKVAVKGPDDCWLWVAGCNQDGYGNFRYKGKTTGAHRVAFLLDFKEIPISLCVLHSCDIPNCCNPKHLFLGTQKDNAQDRARKGRGNRPRGVLNGRAKLTEKDVLKIRELFVKNTTPLELSILYSVSRTQIYCIVNWRNWNHI